MRVAFLGRKSELSSINKSMGTLDDQERKRIGQKLNEVRTAVSGHLEEQGDRALRLEREARTEDERLDPTLPGRKPRRGRLHPLTQVTDEIIDAFVGIGFKVVDGPVVETDYYNFEALNMPPDHPARSMHDTLYVETEDPGTIVVRTHTSPMQIRVMETTPPPLYMVFPGRVARRDEVTPNHLASFMQIEGLVVDQGISFADMKGTLEVFAKAIFGPGLEVRIHPSYFPFTEPSAEVYVSCFACDGSGCGTCRGEGWIEVMGAGMVHPNLFKAVGYPEDITGFAFGMGVERIAKLRYEIHDLRTFYENDVRFLERF